MMTKQELTAALALARSDAALDTSYEALAIFDGCGLPGFDPITCALEALAAFIRYQCFYLSGGIDNTELANLAELGRRRFTVLASGKAVA